jgi:micrococcal nuclease
LIARHPTARGVLNRVAGAALTGALATTLLATPASAQKTRPEPVNELGTVVRVVDGDTVIADIGGQQHRIRITGINAMELTDYDEGELEGDCHAVRATRVLKKLVLGKQVRFIAQDKNSASGDRLRRRIQLLDKQKTDPAAQLLRQGLALWLPNEDEYRRNKRYAKLGKEAADNHRGLWNSQACGAGPDQHAQLSIQVKWWGKETVTITNHSAAPVDLTKWWLRDSSFHGKRAHGYTFKAGTVVPAGGSIVVYSTKGANGPGQYNWGLPNPVFDNVTAAPTNMADGAYLFDPKGDLRAAQQYAPNAPIQFP